MTSAPERGASPLSLRNGFRCAPESGANIEDVLLAVADQIGHENINSASRMNKAVVVFLKNEHLVKTMIENGIWVKEMYVPVTPLSAPATKVTVSNVPPFISNDLIVKELSRFGKIAGGVKMIPLGCKNASLKHVLSFRRQLYMFLTSPDKTLDVSFRVSHGDSSYMLYASTDSLRCFECGDIGHKRFVCPHKQRAEENQGPRTDEQQSVATEGSVQAETVKVINTEVCRTLFWRLVFVTLMFEAHRAEECKEMTDLDLKHSLTGTSLKVRLLLYTRLNVSCGQLLSHQEPFSNPGFNLSSPTTFLIHGYRPTGSPPVWLTEFVELLLVRRDMNVVVVDWNHGATNINYWKVVDNTRKVAANLTDLIQKMKEKGADLGSIHMIGVSLGAHISGFTGANFNGSIGRITALDPAGPQFNGRPVSERLDPSDAQFVEALHTDMDALGYRDVLGHIDYYANGGADQPGCPRTIFSGSQYFKCDHQRSVFLYMSSLNGSCPITAYPCDSYTLFQDGKCMDCGSFAPDGCPVFGYDAVRWRDHLLQLGQTRTYFQTNKDLPFCKFGYKVDIITWNQKTHWGYLTIKLSDGQEEARVELNHKTLMFERFVESSILAQFERDVQPVKEITLRFCTGKGLRPRTKLRILSIRLTPLQNQLRPLCRYDLLLKENKDVTFRPIPCEDSNF